MGRDTSTWAGSAGCVVAARITENRECNVLLLEAGPDCDPKANKQLLGINDSRRVPMRGQFETSDPKLDWSIDVTLQMAQRRIQRQHSHMSWQNTNATIPEFQ